MEAASLLFLLLAPGLLVSSTSPCALDEAIDRKIKEQTSSLVLEAVKNLSLDCTSVTSRGDLATCPEGFAVTSCSCGWGCGSWDVRAQTTCHCQCVGMDWTAVCCCRVQMAA
ncbi:resistin [Fukomys damarensis]|uniref:Resistin n=1 Tax=Fukomys damarensis TaxID=885580 RepID=A0A091DJI7_FUKDA|nr:resistin [Fukomys damarensis]XP_010603904.1 resistin [Fukomys damarensis]XP_010603906.1 resistin [Fukomys damarensis]XP_010603907.1 resistin [Fukomys damarensis]XP_010603908.1 resistin [Fukomys damarensis]XP_033615442.1 resistin [Fukomys damarensis]XP_033615443.1 resistin [Fukomys damarensis]KFO22966.1 Resistin [Fukomys damarensis]